MTPFDYRITCEDLMFVAQHGLTTDFDINDFNYETTLPDMFISNKGNVMSEELVWYIYHFRVLEMSGTQNINTDKETTFKAVFDWCVDMDYNDFNLIYIDNKNLYNYEYKSIFNELYSAYHKFNEVIDMITNLDSIDNYNNTNSHHTVQNLNVLKHIKNIATVDLSNMMKTINDWSLEYYTVKAHQYEVDQTNNNNNNNNNNNCSYYEDYPHQGDCHNEHCYPVNDANEANKMACQVANLASQSANTAASAAAVFATVDYPVGVAEMYNNVSNTNTMYEPEKVVLNTDYEYSYEPEKVVLNTDYEYSYEPEKVVSNTDYEYSYEPEKVVLNNDYEYSYEPEKVVLNTEYEYSYEPETVVSSTESEYVYETEKVVPVSDTDSEYLYETEKVVPVSDSGSEYLYETQSEESDITEPVSEGSDSHTEQSVSETESDDFTEHSETEQTETHTETEHSESDSDDNFELVEPNITYYQENNPVIVLCNDPTHEKYHIFKKEVEVIAKYHRNKQWKPMLLENILTTFYSNNTIDKNTFENVIMTNWKATYQRVKYQKCQTQTTWEEAIKLLGINNDDPKKGWRASSQKELGSICEMSGPDMIKLSPNWKTVVDASYNKE